MGNEPGAQLRLVANQMAGADAVHERQAVGVAEQPAAALVEQLARLVGV